MNTDGTFVLDALLSNMMADPKIGMLIMPRQKPVGYSTPDIQPMSHPSLQGGNFQQPKGKGRSSKGKERGQGKRKKGAGPSERPLDSVILPKALKEANGEMCGSYNSKRICFAYNLQEQSPCKISGGMHKRITCVRS